MLSISVRSLALSGGANPASPDVCCVPARATKPIEGHFWFEALFPRNAIHRLYQEAPLSLPQPQNLPACVRRAVPQQKNQAPTHAHRLKEGGASYPDRQRGSASLLPNVEKYLH